MSQNDFNIANQGFPSFRSDLNSALQALASNSAGTSAPATTYAYMWWYDSTNNTLKMRNADNDAWIDFASFDQATDTFTITTDNIDGLTATAAELNKLDGVTNDAASYFAASGALSNRNLIINGAMQVAQRGTSVTLTNLASDYLIDRFRTYQNSSSTITMTQETDAPAGLNNSLKIAIGTGNAPTGSNELQLAQVIEGYNLASLNLGTSAATSFTLSFWVKSSLTGAFGIGFQSAAAADSYVTSYSISSANTWEYKTITLTGKTSGTWNSTNGAGLVVIWDLGASSTFEGTADTWGTGNKYTVSGATKVVSTSSATWQITGVQLEVGDTATPFEHRSYGQELALCQRYYWKFGNGRYFKGNYVLSGGNALREFTFPFPVTMRATPTIINSGTSWSGGYGINQESATVDDVSFNVLKAGIGYSEAGILLTGNLQLDAEL